VVLFVKVDVLLFQFQGEPRQFAKKISLKKLENTSCEITSARSIPYVPCKTSSLTCYLAMLPFHERERKRIQTKNKEEGRTCQKDSWSTRRAAKAVEKAAYKNRRNLNKNKIK
jgi:hypothetical protein